MAVNNVHSKPNDLVIVDDLIHQTAEEDDKVVLITCPQAERGLSGYERFSAGRINPFVSNAAEALLNRGLTRQTGVDGAPSVTGLLGPSNFEDVITMFCFE